MNQIKFSHIYNKFPPNWNTEATMLLQVFITDKKELSEDFIRYDTGYATFAKAAEYYPLPEGKLLVLMLLTGKNLWQTIRRYTPEKEAYYKSLQGRAIEIVVVQ